MTTHTLDELMARYPHGSRWMAPGGAEITVLGWDPDDEHYPVICNDRLCGADHWDLSDVTRIPDPIPCPITEPTTYRASHYIGVVDALSVGFTGPTTITLHPAEPGATEGRYTWAAAE